MGDEPLPRVWIKVRKDGHFANIDCHNAAEGFWNLRHPTRIPFEPAYDVRTFEMVVMIDDLQRGDVVFDGVPQCCEAMRRMGCAVPPAIDYPDELQHLLGRTVEQTTMEEALRRKRPYFVKPLHHKLFIGCPIRGPEDYDYVNHIAEHVPVYVSPLVNWLSEYRVFVHAGQIVGTNHYTGDYRIALDWGVVDRAVADYTSAPAFCSLDFGVVDDGRTLLVEANDGYSLGSYDLDSQTFALGLEARWQQIAGTA